MLLVMKNCSASILQMDRVCCAGVDNPSLGAGIIMNRSL